jgi:hypothetical protein
VLIADTSAVCDSARLLLPSNQLPATLQYNINLPPLPVANNALAFVALRLATYPRDRQKCDLNRVLQDKFEEVLAVQAQQFKGYLFQTHEAASREVRCSAHRLLLVLMIQCQEEHCLRHGQSCIQRPE